MAKVVNQIELNIKIKRTAPAEVEVSASADLTVTAEEYSEFSIRKGIAILMSPAEKAAIKSFIINNVLPAADEAK